MYGRSVAVIVNGCIRERNVTVLRDFTYYKKIINGIKHLLRDFSIIHIYYHTWNSFDETKLNLQQFSYDKELLIKELQNEVYEIVFEDQYVKDDLDIINAPYTKFHIASNLNSDSIMNRISIYNCFKAYKTLSYKVSSSSNKYDYVLRCRNDLIMEVSDFNEIVRKADDGFLCLPPNLWCGSRFINDHVLFGKTELVLSAISYSSLDEFKQIVSTSWNQEEVTMDLIRRTNTPMYVFPVESYEIKKVRY